ncbi:MAG TPA: sigma-70 family RNA polymerase sigma factor [Herpetosiphonaceae bacterium]
MSLDSARPDVLEQLEAAFRAGDSEGREAEARLIGLASQGDQAAFGALYRQHVAAIYRYCWLHTGGPQAVAEDLTSSVFLRAWQSIGRYEERGRPFLAWLHTIARNLVTDHLRLRGRTESLDDGLPLPAGADDVDLRLEHETLRAALGQLTEEQRQVVTYRFVLGYSGEETAVAMGKKAGAVRALQLRALQSLRAILERDTP